MSKQYKMSVTGRNKTTYLGCVNTTLHVGDRFKKKIDYISRIRKHYMTCL